DPELLQRVRDENIKYAAGEALIAALVRVYGEAALPRLLQAFDDPRLPTDLRGLELWQGTVQLAGFDLAAVLAGRYRGVTAYAAAHADEIAALPRPRTVLVRSGRRVGAMIVLDAAAGGEAESPPLTIRFRPGPDSPLSEYRQLPAVVNEPVWAGPR